jgi:putative tryptophan/tyrosine transport system substrate-binding protein
MRRRDLLVFAGALSLVSARVSTAQPSPPVVGYLASASQATYPPALLDAFRQGLGETGYVEGRNLTIYYQWAENQHDRLPEMAADLVRRKVDVIAATGGLVSAQAAKGATSTIPIVFTMGDDPVASGVVASFSRPGGNITGESFFVLELGQKQFQLAAELIAHDAPIGILSNPTRPSYAPILAAIQTAAQAFGRQFVIIDAPSERDFDAAFATLAKRQGGALIITSDPLYLDHRRALVALAEKNAVPTVYAWRDYVIAGGLMSYGPRLAMPIAGSGSRSAKS